MKKKNSLMIGFLWQERLKWGSAICKALKSKGYGNDQKVEKY